MSLFPADTIINSEKKVKYFIYLTEIELELVS